MWGFFLIRFYPFFPHSRCICIPNRPPGTKFPLQTGHVLSFLSTRWASVKIQDQQKRNWLRCNRHQSKLHRSVDGQRGEDEIVPLFTDQLREQVGDIIRWHLQWFAQACRAALVFGLCVPRHIKMRLSYLQRQRLWKGRQLWAVNQGNPQWSSLCNQPWSAVGWLILRTYFVDSTLCKVRAHACIYRNLQYLTLSNSAYTL